MQRAVDDTDRLAPGTRVRVAGLDSSHSPFASVPEEPARLVRPPEGRACERLGPTPRITGVDRGTEYASAVFVWPDRGRAATMAGVEGVEVVVAHHDCATLRVGDVFLKIDADQTRTDVEVAAMAMAPVPTPEVLWRNPPVLALAAVPGRALGRFGERSGASSSAWAAAGAAARSLHGAPLPPWPGTTPDESLSRLAGECEWLVANGIVTDHVVTRNLRVAEAVVRPWTPVFTHGDLQPSHVFVDDDEVTGVIDWSEASRGDPLYDVASLTLGDEEHLGDVVSGYGDGVDVDVIRGWWSLRSLRAVRWLIEHGFDPSPEVAVLERAAGRRPG